jgi:hypothetical protein
VKQTKENNKNRRNTWKELVAKQDPEKTKRKGEKLLRAPIGIKMDR